MMPLRLPMELNWFSVLRLTYARGLLVPQQNPQEANASMPQTRAYLQRRKKCG